MPDYKTRPLLDIRPNFDGVDHGQLDDFGLTATGLGAATPWKPTQGPKRQLKLPFVFFTKGEWRSFRDFINARRGMLDGFWIPTYLNDYRLIDDIADGSTTFTVGRVNLASAFGSFSQFGHLALIDRNSIRPFQIENVIASGDIETITLELPVAGGAKAADTVCCGLLYARLGKNPTYEFLSDAVSKADIEFIELPREYLRAASGVLNGSVVLGTRPVYLYRITRGADVWQFAGWQQSLAVADEWFVTENISHDAARFSTDLLSESLTISVATDRDDHPFFDFLDRLSARDTEVMVFKTDADAPAIDENLPWYSGRVLASAEQAKGEIKISIGSNLRVADRRVPGPQVQRTCVHRLYDANCKAVRADFTTTGTITTITDAYVEAAEFLTKETAESDPHWFALGVITVGTETRLCTGSDGTGRLFLNYPFRLAQVGDAISAEAGCSKRVSICTGKFDNLVNFLGFPYIPNSNPQFEALATPKAGGGKKS